MVFEKEMWVKSIGPYQAGKSETMLFGYFTNAELQELFKRIDGTDKILVKFKEVE